MWDDGTWLIGLMLFAVCMALLALDLGDREEDANE